MNWRDRCAEIRAAAVEYGRPDLLVANNEYGLGNHKDLIGFTRFTKSLVNVELAMEMYIAGFDMAVFWDNHSQTPYDDKKLTVEIEGYRFTPMQLGLRWLFAAAGTTYVPLNTSNARVHGFAATTSASPHLRVFLINKMESEQTVSLHLGGLTTLISSGVAMVDTSDHWGAEQPVAVACTAGPPAMCEATLPPIAFIAFDAGGAPSSNAVPAGVTQGVVGELDEGARISLSSVIGVLVAVCAAILAYLLYFGREPPAVEKAAEEAVRLEKRLERTASRTAHAAERVARRTAAAISAAGRRAASMLRMRRAGRKLKMLSAISGTRMGSGSRSNSPTATASPAGAVSSVSSVSSASSASSASTTYPQTRSRFTDVAATSVSAGSEGSEGPK